MKITDLYEWVLPKKMDFLNHFKNNEKLHDQALALWGKLDANTLWFMLSFGVVAMLLAIWYYGPYNNRPGRHYKLRHWFLWMNIAAISTFILTLAIGFFLIDSPLLARIGLILRVSGGNAVFAIVVYGIVSFLICNIPFIKTNAYRFLKIGK